MRSLTTLKPEEVLIYLRKSRTDDPSVSVEETLSRHEKMLDDYSLHTWGALVPEQNRYREVVSGETITARPEVQKVLRLIEQPHFRALLIVEPQRLSRGDLEDIGKISKIFRYTDTLIITLQGVFDFSESRDREFFERELMRGNDYLEYTRRIMQNGLRLCVEQGWYVGSHPPYGYRKVTVREGRRNVHTLAIVPEEAEAVRLMFRMYADGAGTTEICNALNAAGVPARLAAKWTPPVLYRILDNPHYLGLVRYDYRKLDRVIVDGELRRQRRRDADAPLFPGRHPAIVTQELWDATRCARKERARAPIASHLEIKNPLAGLVYCECGCIMVKAAELKGRKIRIHCKEQSYCRNSSCRVDYLLEKIAAVLRQELSDIAARAGGEPGDETASTQVRLLSGRLEALTAKQDALWEKLAEGMPRDVFDRLLAKNQRALSDCAEALTEARSAVERAASVQTVEASLYAALDAIQRDDLPVRQVNDLLRAVIRRVTYRRERAYRDQSGRVVKPEPNLKIELML